MNMFRAFMELDEAYNDRQSMIDDIKRAGKTYNFDKYTDAQLFRIWQRLQTPKLVKKEPKHELDLDFDIGESKYCDCGARLSDVGFCPVCYDGEEDLEEVIFDSRPIRNHGWIAVSSQPAKPPSNTTTPASANILGAGHAAANTNSKYIVRIVLDKGRLRAFATDGVHPGGWVAFPNDLRQFEGQTYEVDQLIWNGKNYRVAGNIVEI